MYSYQHKYHAGNFADIHKHLSLMMALEHFHKKETPFCVLDAFSGDGIYDLQCAEASKNKEFENGFQKILYAKELPSIAQQLIQIALEKDKQAHHYPGSSLLIQKALRPQDRAILVENHPQAFERLKYHLGNTQGVQIHKREAYEALNAFIPFKEKRGLIFLDPSYEVKEEYNKLGQAVINAHKKFSNAIFLIWYPLLENAYHQRLLQIVKTIPNTWGFELKLNAPQKTGMHGSGLFFINPPWEIDIKLDALFSRLCSNTLADMKINDFK